MQVAVGVPDRDPVPDADNGAFQGRVERVRRAGVGVSRRQRVAPDVFAPGGADVTMGRDLASDPAAGRTFVGDETGATTVEVGQHKGGDGALRVRLALHPARPAAALRGDGDPALAGAGASRGRVVVRVAPGGLSRLALCPAQVGLVGLHEAGQEPVLVLHPAADALPRKPRRLLPDAQMLRELHGRHPLAGGGRQRERREPRPHRQMGALEGGPMRDLELRPAPVATPGVSAAHQMGVVHAATLRTDRPIRPAHRFKMRPAGLILRKTLEKGQDRHERMPAK